MAHDGDYRGRAAPNKPGRGVISINPSANPMGYSGVMEREIKRRPEIPRLVETDREVMLLKIVVFAIGGWTFLNLVIR
jgi:hypothetical protein